MGNKALLQAHRGVSTDCPENTMSAFVASVEQGYDIIELDPAVTADGKIVVLHDATLTRTGRNADGSEIDGDIKLEDITYEEALTYDYGIWFGEEFAGEKLPLLADVIAFAKEHNIPLKIDNKIFRFDEKYREEIIRMVTEAECGGITCYDMDAVRYVLGVCKDAYIHYDGGVTDEILEELVSLVPKERLVVWVPYKCDLTWWVSVAYADEELCAKVKKMAKLGIWIIEEYEHYIDAVNRLGADIIETTGSVKPCR